MENLAILSGPTLNPVNLQGDPPCPAAAHPAHQQRGGQQCLQSGWRRAPRADRYRQHEVMPIWPIRIEQRKPGETRKWHDGSSLRHHGSSVHQSAMMDAAHRLPEITSSP
ncbi:hypothetical protein [Ralstonia syzygii]